MKFSAAKTCFDLKRFGVGAFPVFKARSDFSNENITSFKRGKAAFDLVYIHFVLSYNMATVVNV